MGNKQSSTIELPNIRLKTGLQEICHEFQKENSETKALFGMSEKKLSELEMDEKMLEGIVRACRIVNVYDGDTATIVYHNKGKLECHRFRIYGYDSPEMRISSMYTKKKRHHVKKKALDAKKALSDFIKNKMLVVDIMGKDKYGRLLGKLYAFPGDITDKLSELHKYDVCKHMVSNGHGYPYESGKKNRLTFITRVFCP